MGESPQPLNAESKTGIILLYVCTEHKERGKNVCEQVEAGKQVI